MTEGTPDASSEVFGHVLFTKYHPPKESWLNEKIYRQGMYTSDALGETLAHHWVEHFEEQQAAYRTNHLLVLWGDDFAHKNADRTYASLDTIMLKIGEYMGHNDIDTTYRLQYSSIGEYLRGVQMDAKEMQI